jgi:hypothetical protein
MHGLRVPVHCITAPQIEHVVIGNPLPVFGLRMKSELVLYHALAHTDRFVFCELYFFLKSRRFFMIVAAQRTLRRLPELADVRHTVPVLVP